MLCNATLSILVLHPAVSRREPFVMKLKMSSSVNEIKVAVLL